MNIIFCAALLLNAADTTLEALQKRVERISWVQTARLLETERTVVAPATSSTGEIGQQRYVLLVNFRREMRAPALAFQIDVTDTACGDLAPTLCVNNWTATLTGPRELPSSNLFTANKPAPLDPGASVTIMLSKTDGTPMATTVQSGQALPQEIKNRGSRYLGRTVEQPKSAQIDAFLKKLVSELEQ